MTASVKNPNILVSFLTENTKINEHTIESPQGRNANLKKKKKNSKLYALLFT